MEPKLMQLSQFDLGQVSELACPVCLGELREAEIYLLCTDCGRGYPIVDGIPVLIAERASGPEAR